MCKSKTASVQSFTAESLLPWSEDGGSTIKRKHETDVGRFLDWLFYNLSLIKCVSMSLRSSLHQKCGLPQGTLDGSQRHHTGSSQGGVEEGKTRQPTLQKYLSNIRLYSLENISTDHGPDWKCSLAHTDLSTDSSAVETLNVTQRLDLQRKWHKIAIQHILWSSKSLLTFKVTVQTPSW